ncbi:MAG: competence protein CoiA [Candidatus Tectomicrobia bacterium]|uniref:Competence protein CoiA n=1 Tax=Tectimicrobiota bacterium TaxID=2528274 RepID=A0A937W6Q9_UNCTE|nr:competence protein CoiA [Candidatus Tectomicrobia bacterium]
MLCAIRTKDNAKLNARDTSKADSPFACPKCWSEVYIRKGHIKVHHFAHKPLVTCSYGFGESEAHRQCKTAIYDRLANQPDVTRCKLEYDLGAIVPDIYAIIRNVAVAIEVQISSLSLHEIIRRTQHYRQLHISVLWLPLFDKNLNEERYAPKAWERWLHATYFGRVYYWPADLTVIPVHFDEYLLYVEESSWYEDGEEQTGGGYEKSSKRWRTPVLGVPADIASNFRSGFRKAWQGGAMNVPECLLYQDTQPRWWKKS